MSDPFGILGAARVCVQTSGCPKLLRTDAHSNNNIVYILLNKFAEVVLTSIKQELGSVGGDKLSSED
jgi:hypothetical protein